MSTNERARGGKRAQRAKRAAQPVLISKSYMYSGSGAGEEEIRTFDEFAEYHIQDTDAALSVLDWLLTFGTSTNNDEYEGVFEEYTVVDREALIAHMKALYEEDPDLLEHHPDIAQLIQEHK